MLINQPIILYELLAVRVVFPLYLRAFISSNMDVRGRKQSHYFSEHIF